MAPERRSSWWLSLVDGLFDLSYKDVIARKGVYCLCPTIIGHYRVAVVTVPHHFSIMVVNTDPSSQQHAIVVTCIVCPIVSGAFVVIRGWTRTLITRTVGWNDCELDHPGSLIVVDL